MLTQIVGLHFGCAQGEGSSWRCASYPPTVPNELPNSLGQSLGLMVLGLLFSGGASVLVAQRKTYRSYEVGSLIMAAAGALSFLVASILVAEALPGDMSARLGSAEITGFFGESTRAVSGVTIVESWGPDIGWILAITASEAMFAAFALAAIAWRRGSSPEGPSDQC